jgi:hypothetical protein
MKKQNSSTEVTVCACVRVCVCVRARYLQDDLAKLKNRFSLAAFTKCADAGIQQRQINSKGISRKQTDCRNCRNRTKCGTEWSCTAGSDTQLGADSPVRT